VASAAVDAIRERVRDADHDQPLTAGFAGVDVLMFLSAGFAEDDVALARHGAVVDAAAAAEVRHVIYTSLAGSGNQITIALPHRWTEARLAQALFDCHRFAQRAVWGGIGGTGDDLRQIGGCQRRVRRIPKPLYVALPTRPRRFAR
jgi:hypothetical protein